jgi:hypothetical protein
LRDLQIYLQPPSFFCDLPLYDGSSSDMDVAATGAGPTVDLIITGRQI